MLGDEVCPECHGRPNTLGIFPGFIKRRCKDCGHAWVEPPPPRPRVEIVKGGYVRFNDPPR